MKKTSSLLLAAVSTAFLLVGAARAAEQFDVLGHAAKASSFTNSVTDGPGAACNVVDGPGAACNVVDGPGAACNVVDGPGAACNFVDGPGAACNVVG